MFAISLLREWVLTPRDIVENVPTDPASLFVYALVLLSVGVIVRANRPKRDRGGPTA